MRPRAERILPPVLNYYLAAGSPASTGRPHPLLDLNVDPDEPGFESRDLVVGRARSGLNGVPGI